MKVRLPGSGGAGNMQQMLKQAQKMQQDMAALQEDIEQREFTAVSGGGAVSVTVDGKHTVKEIKIKPEIVDPDDVEMLEDLITVAVNEAIANAVKTSEDEMGAITGGLNMPGLF
ncbi:MAG TPA: YbaB/EbfC family nucleoid-associated protein [Ruminococcaceae bacterium]|nr:YbaB/EbfC family nucleoid-associated protein [Oscillospiraceae bacterium]HCD81046.1 YbaB/EbfC family nucleoid-associated protein [Oscillospiraceae bacterium]